ncbi:hypothetical protein HK405_001768, partial [Cladochytrium tenue]
MIGGAVQPPPSRTVQPGGLLISCAPHAPPAADGPGLGAAAAAAFAGMPRPPAYSGFQTLSGPCSTSTLRHKLRTLHLPATKFATGPPSPSASSVHDGHAGVGAAAVCKNPRSFSKLLQGDMLLSPLDDVPMDEVLTWPTGVQALSDSQIGYYTNRGEECNNYCLSTASGIRQDWRPSKRKSSRPHRSAVISTDGFKEHDPSASYTVKLDVYGVFRYNPSRLLGTQSSPSRKAKDTSARLRTVGTACGAGSRRPAATSSNTNAAAVALLRRKDSQLSKTSSIDDDDIDGLTASTPGPVRSRLRSFKTAAVSNTAASTTIAAASLPPPPPRPCSGKTRDVSENRAAVAVARPAKR